MWLRHWKLMMYANKCNRISVLNLTLFFFCCCFCCFVFFFFFSLLISESADSYAKLMEELDQMVMRMVFENYGVEKYYDSLTESVTRTLGFIKYKDAQNITSACNALDRHTDKTFTTILHQNQVKGLEIKTKDGQWVGFDYSPSSFILLAADALQVTYYFYMSTAKDWSYKIRTNIILFS